MTTFAAYKKSGMLLPWTPTQRPTHDKPEWEKYMGNNDTGIADPGYSFGGGIRFSEHIGKFLSKALWCDLVFRLKIRGLRIYKYDNSQWTDCFGGGTARVTLDKNEKVKDIYYCP